VRIPSRKWLEAIIRGYRVSDSDAIELRRLAGYLKDFPQLIRELEKFVDSAGVREHYKDQLADAIEQQLAAVQKKVSGEIDWALIPIAGRHAIELSIDLCSRLVIQTIERAAKSGLHKVAIVVAPSQQGEIIEIVRARFRRLEIHEAVQHGRTGLGGAVLAASARLGHEPFALLLPDDYLEQKCLDDLLDAYRLHHCCILSLRKIGRKDEEAAGVATVDGSKPQDGALNVVTLQEKADVRVTGADKFWILGHYVLTSDEIFPALRSLEARNGTSIIELTDALQLVAGKDGIKGIPYPPTARWECLSPYRRKLREHIERFLRKRTARRR
jgi:dTDP-glucose pyrophosphorylase